jgi:hypothetical protein
MSLGWAITSLVGFALIVGGVLHFARRGLDGAERLVAREASGAGALAAIGLLLFLVGLYKA